MWTVWAKTSDDPYEWAPMRSCASLELAAVAMRSLLDKGYLGVEIIEEVQR